MNTTNYITPLEVRQHYTKLYSEGIVGHINHVEAGVNEAMIAGHDSYYNSMVYFKEETAEINDLKEALNLYRQAGYKVDEKLEETNGLIIYSFTISWAE